MTHRTTPNYLGLYYEQKNRNEKIIHELFEVKMQLLKAQHIIDQYQDHYAQHTFTKKGRYVVY